MCKVVTKRGSLLSKVLEGKLVSSPLQPKVDFACVNMAFKEIENTHLQIEAQITQRRYVFFTSKCKRYGDKSLKL